ncbi:FAD/NAD(P)-binding domain-containing protein [Gonapodya prolifera JEL478]|uniref:FAD/NAD(P)-binding domain-containing protein n=1 Tax=Gonapodya prolifera (strain JEL478) TaxID=1344416 RepID=A0A139A2W6_GONPJ|nr:FAD/NAD(P)-binding domain-containing protein [Gonapodya prolifera JEL478]|eukprot:KXS10998.1 FAD/NAD(P)-binding domain-containing protein [Gonapodya prolifera JEL478]
MNTSTGEENPTADVIILGTDATLSILAAALSRIGKSVVHIDSNGFYGGHDPSFSFKDVLKWMLRVTEGAHPVFDQLSVDLHPDPEGISQSPPPPTGERDSSSLGEVKTTVVDLLGTGASTNALLETLGLTSVAEAPQEVHPATANDDAIGRAATLKKLLKSSRDFNVELAPRIALSNGALVELLIKSGVGRYLEFKNLESLEIVQDNSLRQVPCSKEDVFSSSFLTLPEKRRLMRLLTSLSRKEDSASLFDAAEQGKQSIDDYLASLQLSPKTRQTIVNAISLATTYQSPGTVDAVSGLRRIEYFLQSIGRYGPMPFLCPMYGGGSEISQGFCRLSAVYSGTYLLDYKIARIDTPPTAGGTFSVHGADGQVWNGLRIVASPDYDPKPSM